MVILRSKCIPLWHSSSPGKGRKNHLVTAASGSHSPSCWKLFPLLELCAFSQALPLRCLDATTQLFTWKVHICTNLTKLTQRIGQRAPYGLICKTQAKNVSSPSLCSRGNMALWDSICTSQILLLPCLSAARIRRGLTAPLCLWGRISSCEELSGELYLVARSTVWQTS